MSSATTSELAETAAPLDMLLVDAALGPVRRFVPDMSTAKWAVSLARNRAPRRGGWAAWAPRPAASSPGPRPWHRSAGTAGSPMSPGPRTRC